MGSNLQEGCPPAIFPASASLPQADGRGAYSTVAFAAELATTLATLTLFHRAVQHADDKARTVVAIQTMLTAMVAAQLTFLVRPGAATFAQLVILSVFVPGYLGPIWVSVK